MGPEFSVIVADPDWLAARRPIIAAFQVIPRAERLTELNLLSMDLPDGRVVAAYKLVTPMRERYATLEGRLEGSDLDMLVALIGYRWDV
ncbi:hypothetical protein NS506_04604 [Nocardia seriolae]|nr:hypothetical protein NS506_04604 [Nocardia seriolae]BAW07241.1 conserved hypothetical protein [Nocardia seriolae]